MYGIFFFHVLFLFIPSQLPRNLHIGILLPSKAGNYIVCCEADLLLFAEVITASYIF